MMIESKIDNPVRAIFKIVVKDDLLENQKGIFSNLVEVLNTHIFNTELFRQNDKHHKVDNHFVIKEFM